MPSTFKFLRLKKLARNTAKAFFVEWSKYLKLQSVVFDEEGALATFDPVEGTFWRVPVTDGAIRLAGKPREIQVDASGEGFTQDDRDMIEMQNLASRKAMRNPENDYKVIFYPEQFRPRLILFLVGLWAAFFGAVWTSITLPIRVGRLAFKVALGAAGIHDAYSWMLGLCLFWFSSFIRYVVAREHRRWHKYLATRQNRPFPWKLFLVHSATMIGRLIFAVTSLFIVLPMLLGLFVEIYVVLPIHYHLYPGVTPTLRVLDAWAAGLIISVIGLRATRMLAHQDSLTALFDKVCFQSFVLGN
jgi:E3 ubiquitin-protein ligase MARCH6